MGGIENIKIVAEKGHYFSGDSIDGYVEVKIRKTVKARKITLHLKSGERFYVPGMQYGESKSSPVVLEKILSPQYTQRLSLPNGTQKTPPGVYQIPFTIPLPANTPPTFSITQDDSGTKVNVFCHLIVKVKKSMFDVGSGCHKELKVASLRHPPEGPFSEEIAIQVKPLLRSSQGIVKLNISLDRSAYMHGDRVKVRYSIVNQSTRKLTKISFRVLQKADLGGTTINSTSKQHKGKVCSRALQIEPNGVAEYLEDSFKYDPEFPTFDSKFICAKSFIEVKFRMRGGFLDKRTLTTTIDVFTYGYMEQHHGSDTAAKTKNVAPMQAVVADDHNPNQAITLAVSVDKD